MDPTKARILLVDDFEVVRLMLRNALGDLGFKQIDEAENGRIALNKIREAHAAGDQYSIVFCDWNMPDVSGIEVLELCRSTQAFAQIPIIMVTAEAEQSCVIRALKAGATDYIVKPIAPEVLEKKVSKIMSKLAGKAA